MVNNNIYNVSSPPPQKKKCFVNTNFLKKLQEKNSNKVCQYAPRIQDKCCHLVLSLHLQFTSELSCSNQRK